MPTSTESRIGPFEAEVNRIVERRNDWTTHDRVNVAYNTIGEFFRAIQGSPPMFARFCEVHPDGPEHGIGFNFRSITRVNKVFDGFLSFAPMTGHIAGGFGPPQRDGGIPTIQLGVPLSPEDFVLYIGDNIYKFWRSPVITESFKHEYTHYLDSKRNKVMGGYKAPDASVIDKSTPDKSNNKSVFTAYYNSDAELQAYFEQTVEPLLSELDHTLTSLGRDGSPRNTAKEVRGWQGILGRSPREFPAKFIEVARKIGYWDSLTLDNQRRQLKRATTVYNTILQKLNRVFPKGWQQYTQSMLSRWVLSQQ